MASSSSLAALTLNRLERTEREVVSFELKDYKLLLQGLKPYKILTQNDKPEFILVKRKEAISLLRDRFNLYSIRGDFAGIKKVPG